MKRILVLMLVCIVAMFAFASCGAPASEATQPEESAPAADTAESTPEADTEEPEEVPAADPVDVSAVALNGPTAMGMVKFMSDAESGAIDSNNYTFSIETAIDAVTPMITTGDVDIAAVPSNVASVLYNNADGAVQVLAVNTLGVLYIVESGDTVQSIADLEGKTIYASGKGATPEYALNQILAANGLTDSVTVEWKTEQAEVVAALGAEENAIAMLPQPFVTVSQTQNENIRVALDLTEVWNDSGIDGTLITGVVVANTEFATANPAAVADFMAKYEESVSFVNSNVEEAAALVGGYEIVPEAVAAVAIPECNITYVAGEEMKEMLSGYLGVLFEQNPQSIGGAMPGDDFYYMG